MLSRNDVLKVGHKAAEIDMSFPEFKKMLMDWKIEPVFVDDKLAGMYAVKNTEVHFCVLPDFRGKWLSKGLINDVFMPILERYGFVTTAVPDDKPQGHGLVKKFGFNPIGRKGKFTFYRLEVLKWV